MYKYICIHVHIHIVKDVPIIGWTILVPALPIFSKSVNITIEIYWNNDVICTCAVTPSTWFLYIRVILQLLGFVISLVLFESSLWLSVHLSGSILTLLVTRSLPSVNCATDLLLVVGKIKSYTTSLIAFLELNWRRYM